MSTERTSHFDEMLGGDIDRCLFQNKKTRLMPWPATQNDTAEDVMDGVCGHRPQEDFSGLDDA